MQYGLAELGDSTVGAESISLFSENLKFLKIVFKKLKYLCKKRFVSGYGAHCNYFSPTVPGRGGLPAYFKILKRTLIAFTEDTYIFCYIKQAKSPFIYKMLSLNFK